MDEESFAFGGFHLIPAQRLLLEDGKPQQITDFSYVSGPATAPPAAAGGAAPGPPARLKPDEVRRTIVLVVDNLSFEDFHFARRKERMAAVCARHPREEGALRIVLLHDPGAFRHLPEGEGDLVLSGHTHGGQLGLSSLGSVWTIVRPFVDMPDHGLWARGPDRLYVHRGTGHYGFPLRLGVPAEESVLHVHVPA